MPIQKNKQHNISCKLYFYLKYKMLNTLKQRKKNIQKKKKVVAKIHSYPLIALHIIRTKHTVNKIRIVALGEKKHFLVKKKFMSKYTV